MSTFVDFARAHGVEIDPGRLYPSERIKRCGTVDKPRSTNGAYFWDGERGWVFNWAQEARVQWWNDPAAKAWTEAEKAAWKAKRQAAAQRQDQSHQDAARRAAELLRVAVPAGHPYLTIKGFPDQQGMVLPTLKVWDEELSAHRTVENVLLVPMRSLAGDLMGVQQIWWEEPLRKYVKKMNFGMRARGAVFRLGDKTAPETFLCEGYATGLSIVAALRSVGLRAAVVVCFSAGNLVHMAGLIKGRCFVFADNDASGAGLRAAESTGLPFCMAPTEGWDANDLHLKQGLMAVCQQLMRVRRQQAQVAA